MLPSALLASRCIGHLCSVAAACPTVASVLLGPQAAINACPLRMAALATAAQQQPQRTQAPAQQQGRDRADRGRQEDLQHSLAMQNAPRKVFELIGDPRTGLADNVTANPFGEITVDMLHHQLSNEVYWYKYEFSGNTMTETQRDARLSEHTKNLIYLLRAKDPSRWTIEALARKFHVRRQRILAILALKEMEAHRMETGASMAGPLSAYACPVPLDAVHLHRENGEPMEFGRGATAEAQAAEAHRLERQLPQLSQVAAQVQLRLLEALQPFGYSLEAMRKVVSHQVSQIEQQLQQQQLLPSQPAETAGGGDADAPTTSDAPAAPADAGASALQSAASLWRGVGQQLEALLDAVHRVLGVSDVVQEEALLVQTSEAVARALDSRKQGASSDGAAGASPQGNALAAAAAAGGVERLLEGWEGRRLLRLVLTLGPAHRRLLLSAVQRVSIDLNAQGIDLEALASNADYVPATPAARRGASAPPPGVALPPHDVLGFRPVPDEALAELVERLAALEGSTEALGKLCGQQAPQGALPFGSRELRQLLQLRQTYLSADSMVAAMQRGQGEPRRMRPEESASLLKLLHEANPSYPSRAQKYDQVMAMVASGATDVALLGLTELEGSEERARAVLQAMMPGAGSPNEFLVPGQQLTQEEVVSPQAKGSLHKLSWDLVAAFIDCRVAHKVYHRGSGERHLVRLPTYPAFEGYTLQELDRTEEGELSQLNREVAKREEDELYARFRSNLLYNLGLVGPELWDNSKAPHAPNLATTLDRPMVVYDVSRAGDTLYPPIKVVEPDGSERPLNEQERVFQERRRVLRSLPYQLQRIKRKTEII